MAEEKKVISFKNADVAAKFDATITEDITINRTGYHGKLSKISLPVAEAMAKGKSQYLAEKAPVKVVAAAKAN